MQGILTIKCDAHTITFLLSGSCPPLRLTADGRLLKMRQKTLWTLTTMVSFMSAAPIKSWLRPVWSFQKDTLISFSPTPDRRRGTKQVEDEKENVVETPVCSLRLETESGRRWRALFSVWVCFLLRAPATTLFLTNYNFLCCVIKKKKKRVHTKRKLKPRHCDGEKTTL